VNQERIRKQKYGVADPKVTEEENAGKYGSKDCPGAGLGSLGFSKGRSFGHIGARLVGKSFFVGRAVHKSTEASGLQEAANIKKYPDLTPARFTYRRPTRAREGKDLQTNVS
jgi:hypothetical protein